MFKQYLIASFIVGAGLSVPASGQCMSDGWWQDRTPMPGPRAEHSGVAVDGWIYLFGDYNYSPDNGWAGRYHPATGTWDEPLAPMLTGRGQTAAAAVGEYIYVFGGNSCFTNCYQSHNEAYHIPTNTWSSRAPLPGTRAWLTATTVGNLIYVMGGSDHTGAHASNFIYDPARDSWTTGPDMPTARHHHAAGELYGKIYVMGGRDIISGGGGPYVQVSDVDVFDPGTGQWSQVASLPTPRAHLSGVVANGKIYAIGGLDVYEDGSSPTEFSTLVQEYDPMLGCWRTVTPLIAPRSMACAASMAGQLYLFGGFSLAFVDPEDIVDTTSAGYPRSPIGDLDGDGEVGIIDFLLLLANWD